MAQLVKHLRLDFCSGHNLMGSEIQPCVGLCADSAEPIWDFLPPTLSAPPQLMEEINT